MGHMLGEKIFLAYKMERISNTELKNYFKMDMFHTGFLDQYYEIVNKVEDMSLPTSLGGVVYG